MTPMASSADTPAFDALVAAHRGDVLRVCRAIVREEHAANDAAQETFLRLWRARRDAEAPRDAEPWLKRVAVRVALDHARARAARERLGRTTEDSGLESVPAHGEEPLDALARAELGARFARALDELPDGQRAVFQLVHDGGLGLAEVADLLEVSRETVKTQFARAVLRLQAALRADAHDEDRR